MSLMSSLFHDPFNRSMVFQDHDFTGSGNAPMNWKETPTEHVLEFDLPGLTKDSIKLELHDGRVLRVSGDREDEGLDDKGEKWHCSERLRGGFSRHFRLPDDAKVDEIKACMSNGVLVVTVPKQDHGVIKSREVQILGGAHHAPKGFRRFLCCKP